MRDDPTNQGQPAAARAAGRDAPRVRALCVLVMLPLWLGWSFGSIGALQAARVDGSIDRADAVAATVRERLGGLGGGKLVLVTLSGHACTCATAADAARWARALAARPVVRRTVEFPGAPYSTLAFAGDGSLLFAGSPAGAGCGGDPARLLDAVLSTPGGSSPAFVAPCLC